MIRTKREAILAGACRVVRAEGGAGLTLEAAAREAGVSKGGLLYHFPNKEALIAGMMSQICADFDAAIEQELADDPAPGPGRWVRAYVRLSCNIEAQPLDVLYSALVAAIGTNINLLEPLRAAFDRWQRRAVDDGLDPALATMVRLTADGLWFADLMGFAPPDAGLRAQVCARLISLADNDDMSG
ncbi:MAG: TetR family transcriptional regulator [Chloroflexales bacterium]|jgi:AcrR family transcriptional regulator